MQNCQHFLLQKKTENSLTLIYTSSRGLTYFAIGLMKETLDFFKVKGKVDIDQTYKNNGSVKFQIEILE